MVRRKKRHRAISALGRRTTTSQQNGVVHSLAMEFLEFRRLLAADIQNVSALTQGANDILEIEIGGTTPGTGGFDQINVTNQASLDGTLRISLLNNYVPAVGTTYDFLTFGSIVGSFDTSEGQYGFGDGSRYFDVVQSATKLQLVVKELPDGAPVPNNDDLKDLLGNFYSDYFDVTTPVTVSGEFLVGDNVHVRGSFTMDKVSNQTVDVVTGSTTNSKSVNILTIAASDTHFFFGTGGPYWTADADSDGQIDANEVNPDAVGFSLADVDLGMAIVEPTLTSDTGSYFALRATANDVAVVGTDLMEMSSQQIAVEVNFGADAQSAIALVPSIVDFKSSFETTSNANDGKLTVGNVDLIGDAPTARLTSEGTTLSLSDYLHVVGDLAFEYSVIDNVTIATGLPENLTSIASALAGELTSSLSSNISSDFSTVSGISAFALTLAASDVSAFVGLNGPYKEDTDGDGNLAEETANPDSVGVWIEDLDLAFAMLEPTNPAIAEVLPNLYGVKGTASNVQLVGTSDVMSLSAESIALDFNDGTAWPNDLGVAVVDWESTFPAESAGNDTDADGKIDPAGLEIVTPGSSQYIDMNDEILSASVEQAHLEISEYIHAIGNLSFIQGPSALVNVATGLPGNLSTVAETLFDELTTAIPINANPPEGVLALSSDLSTISNLEVGSMQIGGSDISLFFGLGGPYKTDSDADGDLSDEDPNPDASGVWVENVDFGLVQMEPTLPQLAEILPSFRAAKATADEISLVGFESITLSSDNLLLEYNEGSPWPGDLFEATLDWEASFPAEAPGTDTDGDGKIDPTGFEIQTAGDPIYIDYNADSRIAASTSAAFLKLADYVSLSGSFAFEKGPSYEVDIETNFPGDITTLVNAVSNNVPQQVKDFVSSLTGQSGGLSRLEGIEVEAIQVGARDVTAFVGVDGPYWTDLNADGDISWVAPATDVNGAIIPDSYVTLDADDDPVTVEGTTYGDVDGDGLVDVSETAELNPNATGISISDLDVGVAMMVPTLADLPGLEELLPKFYSLTGTASEVALVGVDGVTLSQKETTVNVNLADRWFETLNLPVDLGMPIIDFASSFPDEDLDNDGVLDSGEDTDGDGKLDPVGLEISTGNDPIYLSLDGQPRIAATTENATLAISEFVYVSGTFAFEMGPRYTITANTNLQTEVAAGLSAALSALPTGSTKTEVLSLMETIGLDESFETMQHEVETFTIGARNVNAFVGVGGPYWRDVDNSGTISWVAPKTNTNGTIIEGEFITLSASDDPVTVAGTEYGDVDNNGRVDAGESLELSTDATGLTVADFDFGLSIMQSTNPIFSVFGEAADSLGLPIAPPADDRIPRYVGLKGSAGTAGLVGIDDIVAVAQDIDFDVSFGTVEYLGVSPLIDYSASFPSEDVNHNGTLDSGEDLDGDSRLDLGFEIPTGDEPIYLDYDDDLLRVSVGYAELQVSEFLYVSGSLAFEQSPADDVAINLGMSPSLLSSISSGMTPALQAAADFIGFDVQTGILTQSMDAMTIGGSNLTAFIGVNGPHRSDTNHDGVIDVNDTANDEALGLAITNLDFGIALFQPAGSVIETIVEMIGDETASEALSKVKPQMFAMTGAAEEVAFVGLDEITMEIRGVELDVNTALGSAIIPGVWSPYIDFATSFPAEDVNNNQQLDDGEDLDNDGELDPMGFQVGTGGDPAILDFDSLLFRASVDQAVMEVLGLVQISGAFAIEAGPTRTVKLTNGAEKLVQTALLGASNVYAFAGVDGPYIRDTNDDGVINNQDTTSSTAKGFAVENLEFGMALMASVELNDPSVFVAIEGGADSIGLVGLDGIGLTATATFDVSANVGFGLTSGIVAVDMIESFGAQGLEVATGNEANPINLAFDEFLLNGHLDGTIAVPGLTLDGDFNVSIDESQAVLAANATLTVGAAGVNLASLDAVGVVQISALGLAAKLTLSASGGGTGSPFGSVLDVDATVDMLINTTASDVSIALPETFDPLDAFDVPAGDQTTLTSVTGNNIAQVTLGDEVTKLKSQSVNSELQYTLVIPRALSGDTGSSYMLVRAVGSLTLPAIEIDGKIDLRYANSTFEVSVNGVAAVPVVGSVQVDGKLSINSEGVWGYLQATLQSGIAAAGFSVTGQFQLLVNSTASTKQVQKFVVSTTTGLVTGSADADLASQTVAIFAGGQLSLSSAGVDVRGWFEFVVSPTQLAMSMSATATLPLIGTAAVAGSVVVSSEGMYGNLQLVLQSGFALPGMSVTGQFQLLVNTTSTTRQVQKLSVNTTTGAVSGTVAADLAPQTVSIYVGGGLSITSASVSVNGWFELVVGPTQFAMSMTATATLPVIGSVGLTGQVVLNSEGMYGHLQAALTSNFAAPGFSISGQFQLLVNSTSSTKQVQKLAVNTTDGTVNGTTPLDLPAQTLAIDAGGSLTVAAAGLTVLGRFELVVSPTQFAMTVDATASLPIIGSAGTSGSVVVNSSGMYGHLQMVRQGGIPFTGFNMAGQFQLLVNTTSSAQSIQKMNVNTTTGAVSGFVSSTLAAQTVSVYAGGTLSLTTPSLAIKGAFEFTVSPSQLSMSASATATIPILGNLTTSGQIVVTSAGMYGGLQLTVQSGYSGSGFSLGGQFQLLVNTTSSSQQVSRFTVDKPTGTVTGSALAPLAAQSMVVFVGGFLSLTSSFDIRGQFELFVNSSGMGLNFDATVKVFDQRLPISGQGQLFNDGAVAFNITATGPHFRATGFEIKTGTGQFQVNTSSSTQLGVAPHTARVILSNAEVNAYGFTVTGGLTVGVSNGYFEIVVPQNNPLSLNFFVVNISVSGYFRSNVTNPADTSFSITGSASAGVGTDSFGASGSFSVTVSNTGLSASFSGSARLFGVTFASVSGSISLSGQEVKMSITVTVVIIPRVCIRYIGCSPEVSASKTAEFSLGRTKALADPPAPPPVLATLLSGGVLRLNIGSLASVRGDTVTNESYVISHVSGTASGETVSVTAMGHVQTYTGVTKILGSDAGAGDDYLEIGGGVLVNVEYHGGAGSDHVQHDGQGALSGYGDDGTDVLYGGSAGDTLYGGTAADYIVGRGEADTIWGGDGDDNLLGGDGSDTIHGENGADALEGNAGNDTLYGEADNDNILGGIGTDTMHGGAGNDTMEGDEDADTIYGEDGSDTLLGADGDDTIDGNNGNDMIDGGDGIDTLRGHAGDDEVIGGAGNDSVDGNEGNDSLQGGDGADTLRGHTGTDTLRGGSGNDTLEGNEESDTLYGDDGNDILHGGDGNDTVEGSNDNDTIYGDAGDDTLRGSAGDDLIQGGDGGDVLEGNDGVDSLQGEGGADTLRGLAGNDTLRGGAGNDTLEGGDDDDTIYGDDGADTAWGGNGNDTIEGNNDNDTLYGEGGGDTLRGGVGDDQLLGGIGNDVLDGNEGNDNLQGEGDQDTLRGHAGTDTLRGGSGNDSLEGNEDNDTIYGDDGDDTARGGSGADTIDGNGDNDTIYGDDGNDTLRGNGGDDLVLGGTGTDLLEGNEGNDTVFGGDGADTARGGSGDDTISGDNDNDAIYGDEGSDTLRGNAGDDLILGGSGADTLEGGDGNDDLQGEADADTIRGNAGNDALRGGLDDDLLEGNEDADTILGGDGADSAWGGTGNDTISGENGNDTIQGDADNDTIYGDSGDDLIQGNSGNDQIRGGGGNDTLSGNEDDDTLYGDADNDTIRGNSGADTLFGGTGNDLIEGNEQSDQIYGNEGLDTIYGGIGDDVIQGDADNDVIDGEDGADQIQGNTGDDLIHGGDGNDILSGNEQNDTVYGDADDDTIYGNLGTDTLYGGAGNDTIAGNEDNDQIYGNDGRDTIYGGSGADTIQGDADNDTIDGESGADQIQGNTGDDLIHGGSGNDTISGDEQNDTIYGDADSDTIHGNDGDDQIQGNTGTDLIYGDAGSDTIQGNEDNDQIYGNGGLDTIYGGSGDDTIHGDADNDVIRGNEDQDTIFGDAGSDEIYGNDGRDTIEGGSETDWIFGDNGSLVGNQLTTTSSVAGGNDVIRGSDGDDILLGGEGADQILGDAGRDAALGDDGQVSRDGNLWITSISTFSTLLGGNDTLTGHEGDDVLIGGNADDSLFGSLGNDMVVGDLVMIDFQSNLPVRTTSTDVAIGGVDILRGEDGADTLIGGPSQDSLHAGSDGSSNILIGDSATVVGADGSSDAYSILSSPHAPVGGDDTMTAVAGQNHILGGAGNDTIIGGTDSDVIAGDYADILRTSLEWLAVTSVHLNEGGIDQIQANSGNNIVLAGPDADTVTAAGGNDFLLGDNGQIVFLSNVVKSVVSLVTNRIGNDVIQGGNGANVLIGGISDDAIDGGADRDLILGDNGEVQWDVVNGQSTLRSIFSTQPDVGGADSILSAGEGDVIIAGNGGDTVGTGTGPTREVVLGDHGKVLFDDQGRLVQLMSTDAELGGIDTISTHDGPDIVMGGAAGDSIVIGQGNDVVLGDSGQIEVDSAGNVLFVESLQPGIGGSDSITAAGGDNLILGGADNDTITTGPGLDVVFGDSGIADFEVVSNNQRVIQQLTTSAPTTGGSDTITTGNGRDYVLAGTANDVIGTGSDPSTDVVLGDHGQIDFDAAGRLTQLRSLAPDLGGNDSVFAQAGSDLAIGGPGNDVMFLSGSSSALDSAGDVGLGDNGIISVDSNGSLLYAETSDAAIGGNDQLNSGLGQDVMLGGAGNDRLIASSSQDVLIGDAGRVDFSQGIFQLARSTDHLIGGVDEIRAELDDDVVIGGAGQDVITGGFSGDDILLGDNGLVVGADGSPQAMHVISTGYTTGGAFDRILDEDGINIIIGGDAGDNITGGVDRDWASGDYADVRRDAAGGMLEFVSVDASIGGPDKITARAGNDIVIAGVQNDVVAAHAGNDIVVGDNGQILAAGETILRITTTSPEIGGEDLIYGDGHNDILLGGHGNDILHGGTSGSDIILGDNGMIVRNDGSPDANDILTSPYTVGGGNDTITDSDGLNIIIGGRGNDAIDGGIHLDYIAGDYANVHRNSADIITEFTTATSAATIGGLDTIRAGESENVIIGGPFADSLSSGSGFDIILGDNGRVLMDATNGRSLARSIVTTNPDIGDADTIVSGNGTDYVLGGAAGDTIGTGSDVKRDVVFGDHGEFTMNATGVLNRIESRDVSLGGKDRVFAQDGSDIVIGGPDDDLLSAGADDIRDRQRDYVIGDNGLMTIANSSVPQRMETTFPAIGGHDTILSGGGSDMILGGFGNDAVTSGSESDLVLGDNGFVNFDSLTNVTTAATSDPDLGGFDTISAGSGPDVAFGGADHDLIHGNDGDDVVLGDQGRIDNVVHDGNPLTIDLVTVESPTIGSGDELFGDAGRDRIAGGTGQDTISGGPDHDVVFGDHAAFDSSLPRTQNFQAIFITNSDGGNNDTIHGDAGDDFLIGGQADDTIYGDDGEDDITGGHNVRFGADGNDYVEGGNQADVILGDNGTIERTLTSTAIDLWRTYPVPFADVIREVTRYDDIDRVAGDDTLHGDNVNVVDGILDGDDIVHGQRGNDTLTGGGGDDELLGELGSDTIRGDAGQDFILADVGMIVRDFIDPITPHINRNGSWHRDIVLEEVGQLSGVLDMDQTPLRSADPDLAEKLLTTDLLVLSGSLDATGEVKQNNEDNGAWNTDVLLIDFVTANDDVVDGGTGEDLIFGQRGNDALNGGGDADHIFGDNAANLVAQQTELPKIVQTIRLIDSESSEYVLEEAGSVIASPEIQLPEEMELNNPYRLPDLQSVVVSEKVNSLTSHVGPLARPNGTTTTPFAAVVSDVVHHQNVLPGNDTISGDGGDDFIVADTAHVYSPLVTGFQPIDDAATAARLALSRAVHTLSAVGADYARLHGATPGVPHDVHVASDHIDGGAGNDKIVGDDGLIIADFVLGLPTTAADYATTALRLQRYYGDLQYVATDLEELSFAAHHAVLNGLIAASNTTTDPDVHDLFIGNDVIMGSEGADDVTGDHAVILAPIVDGQRFELIVPDSAPVSAAAQTAIIQSLEGQLATTASQIQAHRATHHPSGPFTLTPAQLALLPPDYEFNLSIGNDQISTQSGEDLVVGDFGAYSFPILLQTPTTNVEQVDAELKVKILAANMARWLETHHHNFDFVDLVATYSHPLYAERGGAAAEVAILAGNDTIDGGDDHDFVLGDSVSVSTSILFLDPTTRFVERDPEFKVAFLDRQSFELKNHYFRALNGTLIGRDVIEGGNGNDILFGQTQDDQLFGSAGDDVVHGGTGVNTTDGGSGVNDARPGSNDRPAGPLLDRLEDYQFNTLSPTIRTLIDDVGLDPVPIPSALTFEILVGNFAYPD